MLPIYPFRWDIAKRNQLGALIQGLEPDRDTYLAEELARIGWTAGREIDIAPYPWLLRELRACSARVVGFCDNSDLYFVGRSPESIFDYLSGLLFDSAWTQRLALLHFSMRTPRWGAPHKPSAPALAAMRAYLTHLSLDPGQLADRDRPVAFVDIVESGGTFKNLISLLHNWCIDTGLDWGGVRRKIRLVGITERQQTSPHAVRWQQHADWVSLLERGSIKNVPVPPALWEYLGGAQAKLAFSYSPERWGDPGVLVPTRDTPTLMALRLAVSLFDEGRQSSSRAEFARALSQLPAMRHSWFRALVMELNR